MTKKYYRYYGPLLQRQSNFLNRMSAEGYRLVYAGKMLYEFESCTPNEYQYCVEFVAEMSKENVEKYKTFLEELGYTVFFKNINLSYSIGKARWRPWAEKGGRIATNATTYNRELLIVEKKNDGKPFELHTTNEDRIRYTKKLRNPWLSFAVIFLLCAIFVKSWIFGIFGFATLLPAAFFQLELQNLKRESNIQE